MFHAIIQARMGSKRLPGKVLRSYKNLTPLGVLCGRLKKIKEISKIIVATTKEKKDDKIVSFCKKLKISYQEGGYRVLSNTGINGGQEVPHLHYHIFGGEQIGKMVV